MCGQTSGQQIENCKTWTWHEFNANIHRDVVMMKKGEENLDFHLFQDTNEEEKAIGRLKEIT